MICKTELLPHQRKAVEKLMKIKVGALYMEQGTGKTRTSLELIIQRKNAEKINNVLWLCPCSVKKTIEREIIKHLGNMPKWITIKGIESLSSSDNLYFELVEYVNEKTYLVVDESNLVKNKKAIRTDRIISLSGQCKYKLILNGTPISRNEADLFAQWYILDWRILGYKSFWSFARNHIEYDDIVKGKISRCFNVDCLTRKIAPYTFQVKKEDCLNLPRKATWTSYAYFTDDQREHYDRIKDLYLMQVDEIEPHTIYKLFTALQNIVGGKKVLSTPEQKMKTEPFFKDVAENPKIQKLLCILEEDVVKEKAIIFCKYTDEIKWIKSVLQDKAVEFYGEVSQKKRQEAINTFENNAQYLIANKTCAGYGLNLQFCNKVIYYSNDWDWATRSQSEDRVHRIGQEKEVEVIDVCIAKSIDERILKCLSRKERLVESFKSSIKKLNKKDIKGWLDGM